MPTVRTFPKGLVFISCGQVTVAEKQLGKDVCALVERLTPHIGYFAENQGSLEALTKYILANLDEAIGLIAIMHPRGTVAYTDETGEQHQHVRASVWIEQEIAVAAYITQLLGRDINVLCYAHRDIKREGIRENLPLNPIPFTDNEEIIRDLTVRLPSWKATPRTPSVSEVLNARIEIQQTNSATFLFRFTNRESSEIFVREVELESHDGVSLTEPITPQSPNEWKIEPTHKPQVFGRSIAHQTQPIDRLIRMNQQKGTHFNTVITVIAKCEINGQLREVRGKQSVAVRVLSRELILN
jgi:hypothetical protein